MSSFKPAARHKAKGLKSNTPPRTKEPEEDPTLSRGVNILQSLYRSKKLYPERLHRHNIAERLMFESKVVFGTARLINQILVFTFFLSALRLSSDEVTKRGIYQNLDLSFDFEALRGVPSLAYFVQETLPSISAKSKEFFPLSSQFFDAGVHGSLLIWDEITSFSVPMPGPEMSLKSAHFSFVAWVKTSQEFSQGYIFRKRPISRDEELTCWGWYLHAIDGPSFIYAGHDHFPTSTTSSKQISLGLKGENPVKPDEFSMLSIVVSPTEVRFFQNDRLSGTITLPRPVTDCFNNGQGLWLGDSGLELGLVRYFPIELSASLIEELMVSGDLLSDIATGSKPRVQVDNEIQSVGRSISEQVNVVSRGVEARHQEETLTGVLKEVAEHETRQFLNPPFPKYPNAKVGDQKYGGEMKDIDDEELDRPYYLLFRGPEILSTTSDEDARNMTQWPRFFGTGATFTFWYRHVDCPVASCGVFLFTAEDPIRPAGEQRCWSLWLENNAIWFDNGKDYQYPKDFVPDNFELNGGSTWRHLALVLDENTDEAKFYMDGIRAWTGDWKGIEGKGRSVKTSDCVGENKFMTIGRSSPGYTYGRPVGLHDLRLYKHLKGGKGPLTDEEIYKIFRQDTSLRFPTNSLPPAEKCATSRDDSFSDKEWVDPFGHECDWYREQSRGGRPAVCAHPIAAERCPIGCKTRLECFNKDDFDVSFIYDRIRRIESFGTNGTICLGTDEDKDTVVENCRKYVVSNRGEDGETTDPKARMWIETKDNAKTKRIDMEVCDDLERAIDIGCSFNSTIIEEWTRKVKAGGGDWTIAFWMKPDGFGALHEGRFFPHLNFYSSLSPPQHNLAIGLFENPNGEAQYFSSCGEGEFVMQNVELKAASNDGWTFVAVQRTNATVPRDISVMTDFGRWREGSNYEQCLYDETAFFRMLEFNYPVLVSPIMLSSKAIPFSKLQETYYDAVEWMPEKAGPLGRAPTTVKEDEGEGLRVEKKDFPEQSSLVAPPIIFQTVHEKADVCKFSYSETFIKQTHDRMLKLKCASPFECDEALVESSHEVLNCPGDLKEEGRVFGRDPIVVDGQTGYADLLYSVVDNGYLFRDGQLMQTEEFLSSNTGIARIILVFYTPKYGITSVLTVLADFQDPTGAKTEVVLQHYEVVEGDQLRVYMVVQIIVLVSIAIMIFDIIVNVKYLIVSWYRKQDDFDMGAEAGEVMKQVMDITIALMVIVYIFWRIPSQLSSAEDTRDIVGRMADIPWSDTAIPADEKTANFFGYVTDLMGLIDNDAFLNSFCNVVLVLSLLRLIKCTSMHPRLALLEGTIIKAWDDLWHAALLILLLMGVFAGIATWRFGSEREDFSDFERSMQTQFEMTFGEFPDGWMQNSDMQVYTVFYFMIVFLLVQNFLLAVVVEAYMAVRRDNEALETEQEFLVDIYSSLHSHLKGFREGWPTPHQLGVVIEGWKAKNSVGFYELKETKMFRSPESIGKFLKFYKHYDFLSPTKIGLYGAEKTDPEEKRAQELELRLAKAMGVNVPSLKEEAGTALRRYQRRKDGRRESDSELGDTPAAYAAAPPWAGSAPSGHSAMLMQGLAPQDPQALIASQKAAADALAMVESLKEEMASRFQASNSQVALVKDRVRNVDVKMDMLIRMVRDGPNAGASKTSALGNGGLGYGGLAVEASQLADLPSESSVDKADQARPPEAPVVDQLPGNGVFR